MGSDAPMMNKNWAGSSAIVDSSSGSILEPVAKGRAGEKIEWKTTVQEEYNDGLEDSSYTLEHSSEKITRVHSKTDCRESSCPVHQKTDHSIRDFPQHFRSDRGFMERICPHGVGHPDPDDKYAGSVHGCDGCCK